MPRPTPRWPTLALALVVGWPLGAIAGGPALMPGDLLLVRPGDDEVLLLRDGSITTPHAFNLDVPSHACFGPGLEVYVSQQAAGEVTIITDGGDFSGVGPFASGLSAPSDLICTQNQILVAEVGTGEITDITGGGDFSTANPTAHGFGVDELKSIHQDAAGRRWANLFSDQVVDFTAGGDFIGAQPFAFGIELNDLASVEGRLLGAGNPFVVDVSVGGDLSNPIPVYAEADGRAHATSVPGWGLLLVTSFDHLFLVEEGDVLSNADRLDYDIPGDGDLVYIPGCGDQIVQSSLGEECDDGNAVLNDGCHECAIQCGNGVLDSGEHCDDGNRVNGDGCAAGCRHEVTTIAARAGDLLVAEQIPGTVANVREGGDFTQAARFATGLEGPVDLCVGPAGDIYALEFGTFVSPPNSGEVTVITSGGDFTGASAYARGLQDPVRMTCTADRILVGFRDGDVVDVTGGGDFLGAATFARVGDLFGIHLDESDRVWASRGGFGNDILDITGGGALGQTPPFAFGGDFPRGMTDFDGRLYVADNSTNQVIDFTDGGDLGTLPVVATANSVLFALEGIPGSGLLASKADGEVVQLTGDGAGTIVATGLNLESAGLVFLPGPCASGPRSSCAAATTGKFAVKEQSTGLEKWKLSLTSFAPELEASELGNPIGGSTRYDLCVYGADDAPVTELVVDRAGDACRGDPCWSVSSAGALKYKDRDAASSGVKQLVLKAGSGKVKLKAANDAGKGRTSLPIGVAAALEDDAQVRVQVLADDGGCFEAVLPTVKAEPDRFKAVLKGN